MVFVFYTTPLRDHLEDKLYDLRTVLKPDVGDYRDVAIVEINDDTIHRLAGQNAHNISYDHLELIVDQLQTFGVKAVVVMLYPNVFSYTDDRAALFSQSMSDKKNVFFGVMGLDTPVPSGREVPQRLWPIRERTAGLEIFRDRRHDFVRQLNFFAYRGVAKRALLPLFLAETLSSEVYLDVNSHFDKTFWLNYISPNLLYRLSADTLLDDDVQPIIRQQLSGRVVFLGYTTFRDRPINSNQIFVNTPWQSEGADPQYGMPLVYVTAMAYLNQLYNTWLKESYAFVPLTQTIIVFLFSLLIWTLGISRAIFLFIACWLALLYFHSLFFAYGNTFIPLADTALFSAIGVLSGSIWRLQIEGRINIAKEAKALTYKKLAKTQSEFLLAFTHELTEMNNATISELHNVSGLSSSSNEKIVAKIQAAAEDFRDYLKGMEEFARLEDSVARKTKKEMVPVRRMVQRILQQFAYRCQEQNVRVEMEIPVDFKIFTDETLLEPIVFNLISNAIKYTPGGDVVTVRANSHERMGAFLAVIDHGPGIAKEFHQKIFKKFYRLSETAHHKVKGSGLGLYLSKYLARRLGVLIEVDSAPGEGATFTIRFGAE